jgi:hypothetical protein
MSDLCRPSSGPGLLGVPRRHARVRRPTCSGTSHNTLKFIDFSQAKFRAGAKEAEQPCYKSRLFGSLVYRPTTFRRSEIDWIAACASGAAPARLLRKAARAVRRRGSRIAIPSGSATEGGSPSFHRFTGSPDPLASMIAIDDVAVSDWHIEAPLLALRSRAYRPQRPYGSRER